MAGHHTFATPKSQAKIARILVELKAKPMTRDELQCLLRIAKPTMRRYIDHLRAEPRRLYIARWNPTPGLPAPVYALGDKPDVPPPPPISRSERNAATWRKIKADRDRLDRVRAAARVHKAIQRVRAQPVTWFAALPGAQSVAVMKEAV
jgi:hypothetical protein